MRDKIKFQKPEEISLEEIQGRENGELNKVRLIDGHLNQTSIGRK